MKNQGTMDPVEIDEMLSGGAFQPSEALRRRVSAALAAPAKRRFFAWPVAWSFQRRAFATGLTVLLAAALVTGVVVALSPQEKAAGVVEGVSAVYQGGLVHPLGETRQAGGVTVTVDWVYADWNQILVAYTAQGTGADVHRVESSVTAAELEEGALPMRTAGGGGYAGANVDSQIASFPMPEQARDLGTVHLHLTVSAAVREYPTPAPTGESSAALVGAMVPMQIAPLDGGDVDFTLEIPVTPGRAIPVGRTVTANGIAATLNDVTLAPSMTTASLCFQAPDVEHYRNWSAVVTLYAGGQAFSGAGSGYLPGDANPCQRVEFQSSIPQDQASYTLRVDELVGFKFGPGDSPSAEDHPEEQMRVKGPWVFEVK